MTLKRGIVICLLLLLLLAEGRGQNGNGHIRFWTQESLSGELGGKGHYRSQQRILGTGFQEDIKGTLFSGRFLLESRSSIIRSGIMGLNIGIEYNPEKWSREFSTLPDRSEVRTLKRLDVSTILLQEKKVTLTGTVNLSDNFINREDFTNLRVKRKFYGAGIYYKNKVVPMSVTYQEGTLDQLETETGRTARYWQRNIEGRANTSFFSTDKQELVYTFDDFIRNDLFQTESRENKVHQIRLNSNFYLDAKKNYRLNTIISDFNQKGFNDLNRAQASANLNMRLPASFTLLANYSYYNNQYTLYHLNTHQARVDLSHQLFESLRTNIYGEYYNNRHNLYDEYDYRAGFGIHYTKKIPGRGTFNIAYRYQHRDFRHDSDPVPLQVMDEEHIMTDDEIVLLDNPNVVIESVVVKDPTGTIIYDLNLDYILVEQNSYVEIKRIPGGQIAPGALVRVDYRTLLTGAYKYKLNNQGLAVSVTLLDQFLELYYRWNKQDYTNIETESLLVLNYFLQNVYGIKFRVGSFARFGVEYDHFQSSIIPYRMIRGFINLQWRFKNRFLFSLNGNIRYYPEIADRKDESYADLSGRLAYYFTPRIKLNLELGYREQHGYQINLNYLTAKTELTMIVRKIYITAGVEVYRREYLQREEINFNGVYLSVVRKFNIF